MEVEDSVQASYPAKALHAPFRSIVPHSFSVENFKTSSCNDKQSMTLPIVMNQNRDNVKAAAAHSEANKPSGLPKDLLEVDLGTKNVLTMSACGNENSPPVELALCRLNTALSKIHASEGQSACKDVAAGLPCARASNDATSAEPQNAASAETLTCNNTPDPFQGVRSHPLSPPKPRSPYKPPMKKYPSLFQDQFTQFMEDRMVQFRPSSSQNNIESSLYEGHPYQVGGGSANCNAMRSLNHGQGNALRLATSETPAVRHQVRESPVNESNSSFMPRGTTGPTPSEPSRSAMTYTPQAVPLEEAKMSLPVVKGPECICMPWNF